MNFSHPPGCILVSPHIVSMLLGFDHFFAVLVVPIYVDVVAVVIAALNRKMTSDGSNAQLNAEQVNAPQ